MVSWLLQVADFMPHGMCLLWRPDLMALHIVSDALIAAAYFAIPVSIAVFVVRRRDLNLQHKAMAGLFAIFITACGMTHLMSILVLWRPYYVAEGVLKAVTAAVSAATAVFLPFLIPRLLSIPSPRALGEEIDAHKSTLAQLDLARQALAHRVRLAEGDLIQTTRRFEAALKGSPVTVFEQDENSKYTWVYNPPLDLDPEAFLGRAEADIFSEDSAERLQDLRRAALESSAPQRAEILIGAGRDSGWFDTRVEPLTLGDGRRGIIATAADITPLKRHQEHLNIVLTELNHRAKNLLTVVIGVVRQTGRVHASAEEFMARLQQRLASLAGAHDVLASQNWRGADLRAIVESQLRYQLQTFGDRIVIRGDACTLPAEGAHYVAMALHELGSNAVKYGALSGDEGSVDIGWALSGDPDAPDLRFVWRETASVPVKPPEREGFGSRILKVLAPNAVAGQADLEFAEEGLRWTLSARLPAKPSLF